LYKRGWKTILVRVGRQERRERSRVNLRKIEKENKEILRTEKSLKNSRVK